MLGWLIRRKTSQSRRGCENATFLFNSSTIKAIKVWQFGMAQARSDSGQGPQPMVLLGGLSAMTPSGGFNCFSFFSTSSYRWRKTERTANGLTPSPGFHLPHSAQNPPVTICLKEEWEQKLQRHARANSVSAPTLSGGLGRSLTLTRLNNESKVRVTLPSQWARANWVKVSLAKWK